MSDLLTFSCPSCGGLLEISEGNTNTICLHCDTPLLFEGIVKRYIADSKIDATEAIRSVRHKLEEMSPGVFAQCSVRKPFLTFVPFWILSCRVDGFVFGVKPVFRERKVKTQAENEDGGVTGTFTRTIRQRKGVRAEEHQISYGIDMIVSAAHLEPLGIPSLGEKSQMGLSGMKISRSGSGLPLKIFDSRSLPSDAHVVDPSVSITQAREEADKFIQRICDGVGVDIEQRSMHLAVTGAREKIIHYPLWVVTYCLENRSFRVIVDGCTGKILKGVFPPDPTHWKKVCRIVGSIWAGLLPAILLVAFSGFLAVGPVLMLVLLFILGFGAASERFLKMAGRNAVVDSNI
jgi:hypothetical protein